MDGKMWFGNFNRMRWVPAPQSGADMTRQGVAAGGSLIDGGGWQMYNPGSHGYYQFTWPSSSSPAAAQAIQAYASGAYGMDLIRFVDPMTYHTNVMPRHWTIPTLGTDGSAPPLRRDVAIPTRLSFLGTPYPSTLDLPYETAVYDLTGGATGFPGMYNATLIPVPPGMTLRLGAAYQSDSAAGVYAAPATQLDGVGTAVKVSSAISDSNVVPTSVTAGAYGVYVWIGKTSSSANYIQLSTIIARLFPTSSTDTWKVPVTPTTAGPWTVGEGNTGCRFDGPPTLIRYNSVNGGQVGFSVSLREVGAWEF